MVGWRHQLNGHESEQTLGVGEGQGGLACCGPWGRRDLGMIQRQYIVPLHPMQTMIYILCLNLITQFVSEGCCNLLPQGEQKCTPSLFWRPEV